MAQVLIVEPSSAERDQVAALLTEGGHQVAVVVDGEEGLERYRLHRHDLVVVDERAPRRSGIELATRLKAESPQEFTPVILVSERADGPGRVQALAVVEDVVTRPFSPAELVARIEALLRTRRIVDRLRARTVESEARTLDDPLTGLRNRLFLAERLDGEWKRAARYNEPLSLLLLGIDGSGELEIARGREFVDRVLVAVAEAAVQALRQIDLVTRHGAAELAALLPNTHFAGSLVCANRLAKATRAIELEGVRPGVSMGIAFYPGKDLSEPQDLLRVAARALERARQEGPGHVCLVQHQGYLFRPQ